MAFKKSLIKEYGEQIWRDSRYSKNTYEQSSWGNAAVARACGQCVDEEKFRLAILKYAMGNEIPANFI